MTNEKKIVCLGGGIGGLNLMKGLKTYAKDIAVVISMADDGGSGGRLRRLFNMLPPGDVVNSFAALCKDDSTIAKLLTYRFPGDRYGKDDELAGQKLGNLILAALNNITGNFEEAIEKFQNIFKIEGIFLPATLHPVSLIAITKDEKEIIGEETIDLGKYDWEKGIESIKLIPEEVQANPKVISYMEDADIIVVGPGDLYTTILPVLAVTEIKEALKRATAKKIFVVNVTNKPFETNNFTVSDFVAAIEKNVGTFPFDAIIVNNNFSTPIPKEHAYTYVKTKEDAQISATLIEADVVDEAFPLYHDSAKLAHVIQNNI